MIDLVNKIALVTGSSRGIGRTSALRLAEAGADIIVNYSTSHDAAMQVAHEIAHLGRRAYVVKADVSEEEDIQSMLEFISQTIGRLDIVVSNAATGGFRPLLAASARHFQTTMSTNVLSLVFLVRYALPLLERNSGRAKVVAISSHGSHLALPMYGLIGGSKAALGLIVMEASFAPVSIKKLALSTMISPSVLLPPHRSEAVLSNSLTNAEIFSLSDGHDSVSRSHC